MIFEELNKNCVTYVKKSGKYHKKIRDAVQHGDAQLLKQLLQNSIIYDCIQLECEKAIFNGWTCNSLTLFPSFPDHWKSYSSKEEDLLFVFEKVIKDDFNDSLLVLAVETQSIESLKCLIPFYQQKDVLYLSQGSLIVFDENPCIYEAILKSISTKQLPIVEILLKNFPLYIDKEFSYLGDILQLAVQNCQEAIPILLRFNPCLGIRTGFHTKIPFVFCVLERVCKHSDFVLLKWFVEAGINLNMLQRNSACLNLLRLEHASPLFYATKANSVKTIKLLIDSGANPYESVSCYFNQSGVIYEASVIFYAAFHNRYDILKYLLMIVIKEKLGEKNLSSPVIAAAFRHSPRCLELLIRNDYACDGCLPHYSITSHAWGDEMLNNVTIFVDDIVDVDEPVGATISMLLRNGTKFTDKVNEELFEFFLFHRLKTGYTTMKIFIDAGGLEFIFCKNNNLFKIKKFVQEQWVYVNALCGSNPYKVVHPRQVWLSPDNILLYIKCFELIVEYIGAFTVVLEDENTMLLPCVPSLQKLCKVTIRSCVVNNQKTLVNLQELNLPIPLKKYLGG